MDEKSPDQAGYGAPKPATAGAPRLVTPPEERPWYLRPSVARWLGPVLIVTCVALRFGWGGIEGPPFPFWSIAYVAGAFGIYLTYLAWFDRKQR